MGLGIRMVAVGCMVVAPLAAGLAQSAQRSAPDRAQAERAAELHAACAELIRGDDRMREACLDLVRSEASQSGNAIAQAANGGEAAEARVAPGERRGSDDIQSGNPVLTAFGDAGRELVSRPGADRGMLRNGASLNSLTTNPVGTFTGQGFNLRYSRAVQEKFAIVVGGRYSSTDALEGNLTAFGVNGGVDYYLVGRNNEGLYAGPRTEVGFGRTDIQGRGAEDFARFGLGGEVGYNFIATNGITGGLGLGANVRVTGETDETLDALGDPDLGMYLRAGLGFSW